MFRHQPALPRRKGTFPENLDPLTDIKLDTSTWDFDTSMRKFGFQVRRSRSIPLIDFARYPTTSGLYHKKAYLRSEDDSEMLQTKFLGEFCRVRFPNWYEFLAIQENRAGRFSDTMAHIAKYSIEQSLKKSYLPSSSKNYYILYSRFFAKSNPLYDAQQRLHDLFRGYVAGDPGAVDKSYLYHFNDPFHSMQNTMYVSLPAEEVRRRMELLFRNFCYTIEPMKGVFVVKGGSPVCLDERSKADWDKQLIDAPLFLDWAKVEWHRRKLQTLASL